MLDYFLSPVTKKKISKSDINMSTENYPANKIPVFTTDIPSKDGYYWWKENISAEPEIVKFYRDGGKFAIERCGDDRLFLEGFDEDFGLFSNKIPGLWD